MSARQCVYLVYYRCNDQISLESSGWWLRWLTSKITKSEFIHVEMRFEDGETYGIVMGGGIRATLEKSYRQDRYTCQQLWLCDWQVNRMRKFLRDSASEPSGYNYLGFFLLPIWPMSGKAKNRWFCSELLSETLLIANVDLGIPPHTITPGILFDLIGEKCIGNQITMLGKEGSIVNI